MATSDKSDKTGKAKSADAAVKKKEGADGALKAAADKPVVPSKPVQAEGGMAVSRIPPSQPIESNLLGKSAESRPAAARKADVASSEKPVPLARPAEPAAAQVQAKSASADPAPVSARSAPAPVVRKTGFWPVALGGVVAAGLGAAATIYALPYLPESWRGTGLDADTIRAEAVAAATEAARAEVSRANSDAIAAATTAAMNTVQEALAEMPPPADDQIRAFVDERLQAALAGQPGASAATAAPSGDVMARLAAMQDALAAQEQRIAELGARPQLDPEALAQVQALAQNVSQVRGDIEAAAAQARESLAGVQSEADAATQRAQAVASVAVLGAVLEGGGSPDAAVQQLQDAGIEVPAPLAAGDLPTLDQLQLGFDAPARAALRDSLKAASKTESPLGAVGNFLRVQTGARSVEPREGDDPDAVLSRAGALVEQGQLQSALDELAALPEPGQAAMAVWTEQAQAYLAAEAALNDVAKSLN